MRAPPQARHAWRPSDVLFAQIEGDGQSSGIAGALSRRESAWALRPLELGERQARRCAKPHVEEGTEIDVEIEDIRTIG